MQDLRKALADIDAIRDQVARTTVFRGYGPATTALTAGLAALAAGLQAVLLANPREQMDAYLTIWIGTAVLATGLIGIEAVTRSRRLHSRLADEMIFAAIEQLIPVAVAGALVTFVLARFAPQTAWMLPGLWQILFSLGLFASRQLLPKALFAPAAWYLTTGLVCLAMPASDGDLSPMAFSPWAMGLPFVIGQLMLAGVLYRALGPHHAEE